MARYKGMPQAIFPRHLQPGGCHEHCQPLGVDVNVGQRSGRWIVLGLILLLVLFIAGYTFAIGKIHKRVAAQLENSPKRMDKK